MKRLKEKPWFNYAVAACIAVILYVVLTHLSGVRTGISTFLGYFRPVILGCVIAYLINPLSKLYSRSLFRRIKKEGHRETASTVLAFITVILLLALLMLILIPQLIESIQVFVANLDEYTSSVNDILNRIGVSASMLNLDSIISSSEAILHTATDYIKNNLNTILTMSVSAGKGVLLFLIAFLLSIYLLGSKRRLKEGGKRLLRASVGDRRYEKLKDFFAKSHKIFNRYIAYNLLDSVIIGIVNAIFMTIFGMPYVGLVSFVVAVANLIPTFGPVIGAGIGGFVLVLVKPWYALAFLVFTIVLQCIDAYLIKPKLFADSLGVPGLWVLIGVIVGGRMFGIVGILLAIPVIAILDMLYKEYFMPWLESKRKQDKTPQTEHTEE